jgi:WD40 repeat protein
MRRYLLVAAMTAAATLTGSTVASSVPAVATVSGGRVAPGARLWMAHFKAGGLTLSDGMAVSPSGGTVFVMGESHFSGGAGYQTVAYRAATGKQLWASRYHSPAKGENTPDAITFSRNTVFVTGFAPRRGQDYEYATVAYRATTGRQLWASTYNGPGNGYDFAEAVVASPDGKIVFVTGKSDRGVTTDYATIAYNAATGQQLWASRYHGPGKGIAAATSLAVSPDGDRVFVTGYSSGDFATIAYKAATGKQLWASRYPGKEFDSATSVAVNRSGTVFVTGASHGAFATIAYLAATGRQLWASRYPSPVHKEALEPTMAVSPAGTTVFVTGTNDGKNGDDYATVAYSAATGKQLWASRYHGSGALSVAVNPHGSAVYVTGSGYSHAGYSTVAYSAATGKQLWASTYQGPANNDGADVVVASPNGTRVFVTGWTEGSKNYEYLTIAYRS